MRNVPREPCTNLCIKRDIWELNYYLVARGNSTTFFLLRKVQKQFEIPVDESQFSIVQRGQIKKSGARKSGQYSLNWYQ